VIVTFKSDETKLIFDGFISRYYPPNIQKTALRKLLLLDAATSVNDLRVPPGNRLEKLVGERKDQYSIRINDRWRICFIWTDENNADRVEIVDYHWEKIMENDRLPNIHPGEILHLEFLGPLDITPYRLSKDIDVAQTRISEILSGKRSITADTALRLSKYFGNSAQFWLNLQTQYDLRQAQDANKEIYSHIPVAQLAHLT
jgi:addiction module HigA family antidote